MVLRNTECMGTWVMNKNRIFTGRIASDYIHQKVSAMQDNDLITDSTKNTFKNSQ
jgi:hypothetical protein